MSIFGTSVPKCKQSAIARVTKMDRLHVARFILELYGLALQRQSRRQSLFVISRKLALGSSRQPEPLNCTRLYYQILSRLRLNCTEIQQRFKCEVIVVGTMVNHKRQDVPRKLLERLTKLDGDATSAARHSSKLTIPSTSDLPQTPAFVTSVSLYRPAELIAFIHFSALESRSLSQSVPSLC